MELKMSEFFSDFLVPVEPLIQNWIMTHVRPQKSMRTGVDAYQMKGLVERELGRYITEDQFCSVMLKLGFTTDGEGHFNSILISKNKPNEDERIAWYWGFNPHSLAQRRRLQLKALEEMIGDPKYPDARKVFEREQELISAYKALFKAQKRLFDAQAGLDWDIEWAERKEITNFARK